MGCPIRKSPDLRLFAPTRGLSQLITSFIASMCLGIPRTPLVALPKCCLSWRWLGYIESPDRWFNLSNFQIVKKLKLVELTGIEPATSWMQIRRSPNWATAPYTEWMTVDQVGLRGLEPRTSSLSGMRSNHLSYKPILMKCSSNHKFSKKHFPLKWK